MKSSQKSQIGLTRIIDKNSSILNTQGLDLEEVSVYDWVMKRVAISLTILFSLSATPSIADETTAPSTVLPGGTTVTVVPNSTTITVIPDSKTVTVIPNSTTVTLPNGVTLPPGTVITPPPGFGAPGTTAAADGSTPPGVTTSEKIEVTEEQMDSLSPEQRAAIEKALESAKASMPATQQAPVIPSSIAGLSPEMLSSLTPEQMKLLEQAKSTGVIPSELKSLIANLGDIPGDVYAKLSSQQKEIIEKARESGVLDKEMLNDILDGLTPEEISAFASGKSISTAVIQKAAAKKTISCSKGKKTVKLVAKNCPKGFKKN